MKKLRYFLFGSIFTVIFTSVVSAYADSPTTITAIIGQIKLIINGEPVAHETLLYNDTTYIPLKVTSEILGKEIAYDDVSKTVYIDEEGMDRQQMIEIINSDVSTELKALNLVKYYYFVFSGNNYPFEPFTAESLKEYKAENPLGYKLRYNGDLGNDIHLVQESEFVIDDFETGEGHSVTFNWYHVNITTGKVEAMYDYPIE